MQTSITEDERQALLATTLLDDWHLDIIKAAVLAEDGMRFKGKHSVIDNPAGWVASEANHVTRSGKNRRRAELVNDDCDGIESAPRQE